MTDITQSDLEATFPAYDAGILNDFGGGNVAWWQDYIRAELNRAYDFYHDQAYGYVQALAAQSAEIERLKAEIQRLDLNGVHTFSDTCDRLPCVQRREIEALKADLECSEKERVAIWNECRDLKSSRIVDFAALTAERARSKALVEAGKPLLFAVEAVDDFNRLNPPEDGRMRPVSLMILDSELRKLATALAQFEKEEK